MFIAIFLSVSSFAVAFLFFTRARVMDAILGGKDLLVHWAYPVEELIKIAEREYGENCEDNRGGFIAVCGFFVIAMIGMLIFGGEGGVRTDVILFIILIIIGLVAWGAPKLERNRAMNASREVYIAKYGIIYEGAVYPFSSFMMRMEGVKYRKGGDNLPAMLGFSFIQLVGLFIVRSFEIIIPVPPGEEKIGKNIAKLLSGVVEEEKHPFSTE